MTKLTEPGFLMRRAENAGLKVEWNRPGDGARRYYFVLPNGRPDGAGDLQLAGPMKGPKLAHAWLDGFCCHKNRKEA